MHHDGHSSAGHSEANAADKDCAAYGSCGNSCANGAAGTSANIQADTCADGHAFSHRINSRSDRGCVDPCSADPPNHCGAE
jgi:hypothetical protein